MGHFQGAARQVTVITLRRWGYGRGAGWGELQRHSAPSRAASLMVFIATVVSRLLAFKNTAEVKQIGTGKVKMSQNSLFVLRFKHFS